MSQSYFSPRRLPSEPSTPALPVQPTVDCEKQLHDVQTAYIDHKDRLLNAIDSTKDILTDLRAFNKTSWVVRYPQFHDKPQEQQHPSSPAIHKHTLSRSLSFADAPSEQTEVIFKPVRKGLARSMTLATVDDVDESQLLHEPSSPSHELDGERLIPSSEASDFHIFRLDLKLGVHGSSSSAAALVSQLEKSSIANLLDERIVGSLNHADKLRVRVEDLSSKVLVTGDLNSGKSTFVNALLRREVMPVDQQPCTTAFCEVHDAAENDGKEEVHVISHGSSYNVNDASTFVRAQLSDLDDIISENESPEQILKLYLKDPRPQSQSLLNNGIANISLIDAPGLNRDSLKTTALFARQEEIDVIVFCVSAENHFTLSAREFLFNASNEKAYIFIVVNKYDQIRDKNKCRKRVLEQIKEVSPRTHENSDELVHFVDSASILESSKENSPFENLEAALRSFVINKRSQSKLNPASNYLSYVLSDVDLLVGANAIVAKSELERAKEDLRRSRPILEKMKNGRDILEDSLEAVEEDSARTASSRTKQILNDALDRVGSGLLGLEKTSIQMPSYPGLLGIWDYARDVRKALLASLDMAVNLAEDEARITTTSGVNQINQLGDEHLPQGVERTKRIFMPQAMFSTHVAKDGRRKSRRVSSGGAIVAGGMNGLGIGLAQRGNLLEPTFFDLFDVQHQWFVQFGDKKAVAEEDEEHETAPTALGIVSVGLGALTMVGGQAIGARGIVEGIMRISDLLGNEGTRKWAAPVLGATALGLTAYFIIELPSTIPRTIGRRVKRSLVKKTGEDGKELSEDSLWVYANAGRVSKETRKVLRLASWDLQDRFRRAMEERAKEVRTAEEMEKKADKALTWFNEVGTRTADVRDKAGLIASA